MGANQHRAPPDSDPIGEFARELKAVGRELAQGQLASMGLVGRAEFDAAVRVLERLRERLAAIDARLATLEPEPGDRPD